jgi:hypothetical protein
MKSSQWDNWNHIFCRKVSFLTAPHCQFRGVGQGMWSRPICICCILYFKLNGIDAILELCIWFDRHNYRRTFNILIVDWLFRIWSRRFIVKDASRSINTNTSSVADINRIKGRIQDISLSEEVVYRDRCKTTTPVLATSHEGNNCFVVPKLLSEGHFTVHLNFMFWFPPNSISFHYFILLIDILNGLFCNRQNNFRYKKYNYGTWLKKNNDFQNTSMLSGFFNGRQPIIPPLLYIC